jgi:methylglutaconyl-CoA hydratase
MAEVRYEVAGQVASMTLARVEKRNALNASTLTAMTERTSDACQDPNVRVLLIAADGPAFCAGADLSESAADSGGSFADSSATLLAELLTALLDCPKPVVARVQGPVAGGGNGLLAASDIVVASTSASFALREVRLGVIPAVIAVPLLDRLSASALRDLMLTGRSIDAYEAQYVGLVHRVVEPGQLDTAVASVVGQLLSGGPAAQTATKQLLSQIGRLDRAEAFQWAAQMSKERFSSPEAQEGIAAFRQKRPPSW